MNLGDRMKQYEAVTRLVLPRRTYTLIRVDGRAFHTLLRGAEKPFDQDVANAMAAVAEALCKEVSGAAFAYTQSDECSVLVTDFQSTQTEPWFGGVVQKIASVSASIATLAFNDYENYGAHFDSRVFTIPSPYEVGNYFTWRYRDAVKNSISMAAQSHFSHKSLQGLNSDQLQEKLWQEAGVNWSDYPEHFKNGQLTTKQQEPHIVTYVDGRTNETITKEVQRTVWRTNPAPLQFKGLSELLPYE